MARHERFPNALKSHESFLNSCRFRACHDPLSKKILRHTNGSRARIRIMARRSGKNFF
jgi:hypothetical protein